jgi:hypothetical protein
MKLERDSKGESGYDEEREDTGSLGIKGDDEGLLEEERELDDLLEVLRETDDWLLVERDRGACLGMET